jgi:hypothetical protein
MAKKKSDTHTADLFDWAAANPPMPKGEVIRTDVFKWKMIRQGGKAASVRKGEWPARAFWREEPGEIVSLRRQA